MADGDELDSLSSRVDVLPGPDDENAFDAPWQARTFGIAVALLDEDAVDRERFRAQVRGRHGGDDGGQIDYRRWVGALEEATVEA